MSDPVLAVLLVLFVPVWLPLVLNTGRLLAWLAFGAILPFVALTLVGAGVLALAWLDAVGGFRPGTSFLGFALVAGALVVRLVLGWACRRMIEGWL